ncbi:MAG: response regulator transcription factor [Clostridia bacterium]|nr:response regulator transcription factor [Clostridia bacterium]
MRILLVEDNYDLSDVLTNVFRKEKYEVLCAYDGEEGLMYALENIYDIIILDVMMPKMNGFEVLKKIREAKLSVPVIMLTALSEEKDKIKGLDGGADDYLPKPFSTPELLARVRALTRRKGELLENNELKFMDVSLNYSSRTLNYKDKSIGLSVKEFNIMDYLLSNPTAIAEKEKLISRVWGLDNDFESNNLEAFMSFLRKKLDYLKAPFYINSKRGVGYQLVPREVQ